MAQPVPHNRTASVTVFGTGAMASLFGARLARTGRARVTLAGTWRAALEAISVDGITVEEDRQTWSVPAEAAHVNEALGPADLVIVLVKCHQTASVSPHVARALAPNGMILTLQNGIGNREILEKVVGEGRVALGVMSAGATMVGPGHVRAGGPGLTVLGTSTQMSPAVDRAAGLLLAAGMATEVRDDIDAIVWRKLAVNCAINPLTALLRVPNGQLLEIPDARQTMEAAAREVGTVASAMGLRIEEDLAALAVQVATDTAGNRSSMLQDVERGARTEIDAINGAVAREGRRLGVPVPVNEGLWQAVSRSPSVGDLTLPETLQWIQSPVPGLSRVGRHRMVLPGNPL